MFRRWQNSSEPNRSRCVTSPSSQGYRYWVTQASGWTVSCTRDKPDSKRSESSMLPSIRCQRVIAGSERQRAVGCQQDCSWTFGTGYGGRSPLVSQLAFDKRRSWAISASGVDEVAHQW